MQTQECRKKHPVLLVFQQRHLVMVSLSHQPVSYLHIGLWNACSLPLCSSLKSFSLPIWSLTLITSSPQAYESWLTSTFSYHPSRLYSHLDRLAHPHHSSYPIVDPITHLFSTCTASCPLHEEWKVHRSSLHTNVQVS